MTVLHDIPRWLFAALTIAVFVGGALTGLVATRTWGRARGLHALVDNSVIGWMFSALLVMYAIAIGLIAVATWGNAGRAQSVASAEASRIAAVYRDVSEYPEPARSDLRQRLVTYTRFIVDEAWPIQRRGGIPFDQTERLSDFEHALYGFQPATEAQRIVHAETLREFNELVQSRRQRLEAIDYSIPGTLWSVVLIGAVMSIVGSFVFSTESLAPHAIMTALLAAMIGLLVFFIASTDRPYRGTSGVPPTAYELVLRDLMKQPAP